MNASLLLATLLAGAPPTPPSAFAPTLHVRMAVPEGVKVTLRPGTPDARVHDGPAQFAVRPGYLYRIAMSGFADEPATVVYPSLEVRASLFMPVTLKSDDWPATVRIGSEDLRRVLAGGMVTKIVYLENPDLAPARSSTADEPIETDAVRGEDAMELAYRRGRPLMVVRIGGTALSTQELQTMDVPGTLQQAGDPPLGPPAQPPMLPARTFQLYDPILGPKTPTEELLQDGGDVGPRIGIAPNGKLGNLDPTDSAVEYRYGEQARRTATSNRICLFAPRFAAIIEELNVQGYSIVTPSLLAEGALAPSLNRTRLPSETVVAKTPPMATIARTVVRGMETRVGVHELDIFRGAPLVLARVDSLVVQGTVVEPLQLTQYRDQCKPNDPLVLVKIADPKEAKPGDTVTITLKVINYGSRAARDVVVSDSLTSRLEYIAGTSRGDRPTVFTQQNNEVGSSVLRWEFAGEIPPGQFGVVQFQVKVR